MDAFSPTERTTVHRLPTRARYGRETIEAILDEGFFCHVGFCAAGQVHVIPTLYGRAGETLYLHGSAASRMLRTLADGVEVCVSVTLVDGLVLARSAFHHSMNYRSVVLYGRALVVEGDEEKLASLRVISEHVVPGRWDEVRPPTERELRATLVLALPLREVSAKVRSGPPVDDEEDHELPVWAGEIPFRITAGAPVADPRLRPGIALPPWVSRYRRPGRTGHQGEDGVEDA